MEHGRGMFEPRFCLSYQLILDVRVNVRSDCSVCIGSRRWCSFVDGLTRIIGMIRWWRAYCFNASFFIPVLFKKLRSFCFREKGLVPSALETDNFNLGLCPTWVNSCKTNRETTFACCMHEVIGGSAEPVKFTCWLAHLVYGLWQRHTTSPCPIHPSLLRLCQVPQPQVWPAEQASLCKARQALLDNFGVDYYLCYPQKASVVISTMQFRSI